MSLPPVVTINQIVGDRLLFVSRWWGFRPQTWGAVLFSEESVGDRWLRDCPGGGFVLGFASHNPQEEVEPEDRGRVLGLYEFAPEKALCSDPEAIDQSWLNDPRLKNAQGRFRWPFGFKAIRAWRFVQPNVMTRGTLPNARSRGFILTRDMLPIDDGDRDLVNQHFLQEVELYRRPFLPLQLTEPNATPDANYLLVCKDPNILGRIPAWRPGEFLYKPGIASDVDARRDGIKDHAIARLFGLVLHREWSRLAPSPAAVRQREESMIAVGERICRPAASGQREYFLGPPSALMAFIEAGGGITRVA